MKMHPPREKPSGGSVLVIVLVTIVFTTAALLAFIERASDDLLPAARAADAKRLRVEAYSALETTFAVLEDFRTVNGSLRSPAEGWGDPLGWAGYLPAEGRTVEVSFVDESGKLSLPSADQKLFEEVFEAWELPADVRERLTESLLTWMKKDYNPVASNVTRPEDYERDPLPFKPPGRSLRSWKELGQIDGVKDLFFDELGNLNELGHRFETAFSLYKFAEPNLNAGAPDTLLVLGEYDVFQQQRIVEYLTGTGSYVTQGPGVFKDVGEVSRVASGKATGTNMGTEIRALWVVVNVREGQSSFSVSALIAPPKGATAVAAVKAETSSANPSSSANRAASANNTNPTNGRTGGTAQTSTPSTGTTTTAASLNYPFTVLEIRENDVPPAILPAAAPL